MKWRIVRKRGKRTSSVTKHYLEHKETARTLILQKLEYWNQFYGFSYKRVAIRNTRRCWGSCTSLKNLNFSYKLLFLPEHLQDYVIVHELCHLQELHHQKEFWLLMEKHMPDYAQRRRELRAIEKLSAATFYANAILRTQHV
jgi:predicted metal-dependent hydrolase